MVATKTVTEQQSKDSFDSAIDWKQESKRYDDLLEDMDEWSKEDWSDEEQKAFERAMTNL